MKLKVFASISYPSFISKRGFREEVTLGRGGAVRRGAERCGAGVVSHPNWLGLLENLQLANLSILIS